MDKHPHITSSHHSRGSLKTYLLGFILSIILTLAAYFIADRHLFTGLFLPISLYFLGTVQAVVQLILFLGLYKEGHPRWHLTTLLFMAMVILIVVLLSLWIMHNLNYQLMPHT